MTYDYAAVADRIESLTTTAEDREAVMALLLRENAAISSAVEWYAPDGELAFLLDVGSFENLVASRYAYNIAGLNDVGRSESGHYAGFEHRDFGNDYGNGPTLGAAMWAAFVRVVGQVDLPDSNAPIRAPGDPEATTAASLRTTAERLAKSARWFTSDEGLGEMMDKSYVAGSVHRALMTDILHDGIDSGEADPVRTVARALTVLAGERGSDRRLLDASQAIEPFIAGAGGTKTTTSADGDDKTTPTDGGR